MRVCIYGAGAMGTSLGACLAGEDPALAVDFVTRNRAHVEALNERGAVLVRKTGDRTVRVHALLPEEMTREYDVIFLATKQRQNEAIAHFLAPFLKRDGALVTVQNGLPEEKLAAILGPNRVYGCALGWGAELLSSGTVGLTSEGELCLAFGAYGRGDKTETLRDLLSSAFSVTAGNLAEIRYSKLVVNAAFSTLSAVSGLSFGELAKRHKKPVLSLMKETIAVAKAAGCKRLVQNGHDILSLFSSPFAALILPVAMKKHRDIRSGMLKDLREGRPCDVDFVAGAVIGAGEALGVPTPRLSAAVALVHGIENGRLGIDPENLERL